MVSVCQLLSKGHSSSSLVASDRRTRMSIEIFSLIQFIQIFGIAGYAIEMVLDLTNITNATTPRVSEREKEIFTKFLHLFQVALPNILKERFSHLN
ncbi:hypothetical protein BpHYR1_028844 [Brachionus plicatilis]|uniref:Uncharacterized protein n=1 Tax=Brachionus plicatilis TaxID=10195 RepID=A0A3M7P0Z5_BRAPC|nr:hypothetical protein BpHYR1_028844 [Brachionus plicatilis]